jgi:hypothetical protein
MGPTSSGWTADELAAIGAAEELRMAPRRRDGSPGKALPIWVVRAGDELYVRAAYGAGTGWHRRAQASRAGRIAAGGVEKDVRFEDAPEAEHDRVDAAYREKYGRYARIVDSVLDADARASTLRLVPAAG